MTQYNFRSSVLVAVLVAWIAVVHGGPVIAANCPSHVYLGNNPNGTDSPDWSDNAQGLANDGQHWFFTHKIGLLKYDANWRPVGSDDDIGKLGSVSFPPELVALGFTDDEDDNGHFGDPDYYAGYVFVPFESNYRTVIGAFRAADLVFVDWVDVSEFQSRAGWVAIDPVERMLYTSDDDIVAGIPLLRYAVDVSKLENDIHGDFLTPTDPIALREADGSPVAGQFSYMQGGVFTPWGDLYLAVGKTKDSPEDSPEATRGGLHLFRRTPNGTAFRLVESSVNVSAHVGDPVFAYEYDPSGPWGSGEEPEGLDWWDRDVPDSRYSGQLHAILLDNQARDDQIWLKHYRVDYGCIGDVGSEFKSDILWRSSNGDNVIWPGAQAPGFWLAPLDNGWQVAGIGDFDNDDHSDILWRSSNGANVIWPGAQAPGFWLAPLDNGWQVAGIGDFDNDDHSDILWRSSNGANVIWPGAQAPGFWLAPLDNGWQVAGIGDFDNNGHSDILWRSSNGDNVIWPGAQAPGFWLAPLDNGWQVAGIGDFDNNGHSDILWRSSNGANVIWPGAQAPGFWLAPLDNGWQVAGIGDFNGDGKSDILWRSGNGANVIWPGAQAPGFWLSVLNGNWQVQGVGNFD